MAIETTKKRQRYDKEGPEAKALIDEIVHGTFMKEGTMVAFPLCFPGVTMPIAADESRVTALDVTDDGVIYGGTSGRQAHLFVGMFHGVTGCVFDMGVVEDANQCAAMCCGKSIFVACVNGPKGGRILTRRLQPLPFDLLQEWGFTREPLTDLGRPFKGERIVHAVASRSRKKVIGTTQNHLFTVDFVEPKIEIVGEVKGVGRLGVGPKGSVYGIDEGNTLWRFDPKAGTLKRKAVKLPKVPWDAKRFTWAREAANGKLYTADAEGRLYMLDGPNEFSDPLGQTRLAPVTTMAVTLDGRVFGFCGDEISRMFCYDPAKEQVRDLGVALSTLERRRYGYEFADAVTGRDGQIVFGEDDDLGHLWLYFPKIQRVAE
ncbi:MAG: hypothetical protein JXQ73_05210 [Phycisphaerae bacterium]|nr:hypothetical protein [Phycisphaerae bacterium]